MHTVNRIIVVLLSLLLIAAAAGLIGLAWMEDQFLDLELDNFDLEAAIITDGTARLLFTVVCGAIAALGLAFIALQFVRSKPPKEQVVRLKQASGDQVEMTTSSIEAMLRHELEALPEVRSAGVRVREEKDGLASVLDLHLLPEATVAHVTSDASHVVASAYRERLGISATRRPLIRVHYEEVDLAGTRAASQATAAPAVAALPAAQTDVASQDTLAWAPATAEPPAATADASQTLNGGSAQPAEATAPEVPSVEPPSPAEAESVAAERQASSPPNAY